MLSRRSSARAGLTIIELIVAMVVGGVVLALVATISVRQQRLYADLADRLALDGQLRQAAGILPIDLRGAASAAGDIREARDTAVEVRTTIASAIVCDSSSGAVVLAPTAAGEMTFASYLTTIAVGDTAWIFTPSDSLDAWLPYTISGTGAVAPGSCASLGPQLSAVGRATNRIYLRLTAAPSVGVLLGSVLRVTRPVRYSLYRGGDSRWYLGQRDWNVASLRFNTIQPVSGPFASPSSRGVVFQYADSTGAPLAVPVADPRAIALVHVDLRGQSRSAMRAFARGAQGKSADSLQIAISIRNRQ